MTIIVHHHIPGTKTRQATRDETEQDQCGLLLRQTPLCHVWNQREIGSNHGCHLQKHQPHSLALLYPSAQLNCAIIIQLPAMATPKRAKIEMDPHTVYPRVNRHFPPTTALVTDPEHQHLRSRPNVVSPLSGLKVKQCVYYCTENIILYITYIIYNSWDIHISCTAEKDIRAQENYGLSQDSS